MDAYLVTTFENDVDLGAFFLERDGTPWLYSSSSLGMGDNPQIPQFPYVVYNELPSSVYQEVSETSNAEQKIYLFYVYDAMGDFTRINQIMREIRRIVKTMVPFVDDDGVRCSGSRWDGISGRMEDDTYHSVLRFGTARFTVSD